jgi:hypothetical protein
MNKRRSTLPLLGVLVLLAGLLLMGVLAPSRPDRAFADEPGPTCSTSEPYFQEPLDGQPPCPPPPTEPPKTDDRPSPPPIPFELIFEPSPGDPPCSSVRLRLDLQGWCEVPAGTIYVQRAGLPQIETFSLQNGTWLSPCYAPADLAEMTILIESNTTIQAGTASYYCCACAIP